MTTIVNDYFLKTKLLLRYIFKDQKVSLLKVNWFNYSKRTGVEVFATYIKISWESNIIFEPSIGVPSVL